MKFAGIITNSSKDYEEETKIAVFSAFTGIVEYSIGAATITIDFDKSHIEVNGMSGELFSWDATEQDCAYHEIDFGIYLSGRVIHGSV